MLRSDRGQVRTVERNLAWMADRGVVAQVAGDGPAAWTWTGSDRLGAALHAAGRVDAAGEQYSPSQRLRDRHQRERQAWTQALADRRERVQQAAAEREAAYRASVEVLVLDDGRLVLPSGEIVAPPQAEWGWVEHLAAT